MFLHAVMKMVDCDFLSRGGKVNVTLHPNNKKEEALIDIVFMSVYRSLREASPLSFETCPHALRSRGKRHQGLVTLMMSRRDCRKTDLCYEASHYALLDTSFV